MGANVGILGLPPGLRRATGGIRNFPLGLTSSVMTVPAAANTASFQQTSEGQVHVPRGIIGFVGASSGNVCISVFSSAYSNDNAGTLIKRPSQMIATTGLVPCPAGVNVQFYLPFAQTAECRPGDWLMVWADNTTASFAAYAGSGAYGNGYFYTAGATPPVAVQASQALSAEGRWFNMETIPL